MNPYGITQVDVPGLLSVYQGAQDRRAQQMKARREEERAAQREDIMTRVFAPKAGGGVGSVYGEQPQGSAMPNAVPQTPQGPPQSLVDPSQLAPRTDGVQLNQDALRELYAVDPQTALQLQTSVYNANKQQLDQMQAYGEAGLGVVYRLKRLPAEQRAAELKASLPMLQSMGIDTAQLAQADLTDNGLSRYEAVFGKLADLQPKLRNVGPGDMIIDERRIGQPGDPTVYESPIVKGEDGVLYERQRAAPQQQTATNPQTGETVAYNPQTGAWEPLSAPPVNAAPGRPNTIARSSYQAWVNEYGKAEADAMMQRNGLSVGNY